MQDSNFFVPREILWVNSPFIYLNIFLDRSLTLPVNTNFIVNPLTYTPPRPGPILEIVPPEPASGQILEIIESDEQYLDRIHDEVQRLGDNLTSKDWTRLNNIYSQLVEERLTGNLERLFMWDQIQTIYKLTNHALPGESKKWRKRM
jgi:hypothetical protein